MTAPIKGYAAKDKDKLDILTITYHRMQTEQIARDMGYEGIFRIVPVEIREVER